MSELFSVEGKVVLVTGGARGIGRMIAAAFAGAGARVYLASRDAERGRATAREIGATSLTADVGTEEGREQVCTALREAEGQLHVLVNNAALHWVSPLQEQVGENWDRLFSLNVRAPFELTVGLLDLLEKTGRPEDPARVIHIGSTDGLRVPALESYAYGASKAGLHHLTRHMARRLTRRHITVNAIAPGSIDTDMLAPAMEKYGDKVLTAIPLKRIGGPDDIAGVAIFLASRASAYMTGAVLPVDGGMGTCG